MNKETCTCAHKCTWSGNERFCRILDKAGIPNDQKWRAFILFFRNIKDLSYLSDEQKKELQALITEIFTAKDYSEDRLERVYQAQHAIMVAPYKKRVEEVLLEASEIVNGFKQLLSSRRDNIVALEEETLVALEQDLDEDVLLAQIRNSFNDVKTLLENDMRSLEAMAVKDSLTGIPNRRAFDTFISTSVERWKKHKIPVAFAMFDIDHFKKFNDEHGHRIGDQALLVVARQIDKYIQPLNDDDNFIHVARYGGEEFGVIYSGSNVERFTPFMDKIRKGIGRFNFIIRDVEGNVVESGLHLTVSVGVATIWDGWHGAFEANLVEAADSALYVAKNSGRNKVAVFTPDAEQNAVILASDE